MNQQGKTAHKFTISQPLTASSKCSVDHLCTCTCTSQTLWTLTPRHNDSPTQHHTTLLHPTSLHRPVWQVHTLREHHARTWPEASTHWKWRDGETFPAVGPTCPEALHSCIALIIPRSVHNKQHTTHTSSTSILVGDREDL